MSETDIHDDLLDEMNHPTAPRRKGDQIMEFEDEMDLDEDDHEEEDLILDADEDDEDDDDDEELEEDEDLEAAIAAVKRAPFRRGDRSESVTPDDVVISNSRFKKDLDTLVMSEKTLSLEFKTKAAAIFESAVKETLADEINLLEEEYEAQLTKEVTAIEGELLDKVDGYMDYVVEQWMEENELAVETSIRAEVAEKFMDDLKDLFVESYIDVPESRVDLVDDLEHINEELQDKVNEATDKAIEIRKTYERKVEALEDQLERYKREAIVDDFCHDLTRTEAERLHELAAGVSFDSKSAFSRKIEALKDVHFKNERRSYIDYDDVEDGYDDEEEVRLSSSMESYVKKLQQFNNS